MGAVGVVGVVGFNGIESCVALAGGGTGGVGGPEFRLIIAWHRSRNVDFQKVCNACISIAAVTEQYFTHSPLTIAILVFAHSLTQ